VRPWDFSGLLALPAAPLRVLVDRHVLARREHDVEVTPPHRRLRPPPVDDAPLLAHLEDPHPLARSRYPLLDRTAHGSTSVKPRPRRNLHDSADRLHPHGDPHLADPFAEAASKSTAARADEL